MGEGSRHQTCLDDGTISFAASTGLIELGQVRIAIAR